MGTRLVLPYGPTNEFIQKVIPDDEILQTVVLPSLDEFIVEPTCLSNFDTPIYNLVHQQYWEYYNWYNADETIRQFLSPIVHTFKEKSPVLCFPKFIPLVSEDKVYEYNEIENVLASGITMGKNNLDDKQCIEFYRNIPMICNYLNLEEGDIIYNPSNIGYNPTFGLRIIDYGLVTI